MAIQTRLISYQHDAVTLEGFLAWDDSISGQRPAVAICHTWGGRSEFEQNKAVQLAELGYVGFALDMYGQGVLGAGPEENSALMAPFMQDRALLQARVAVHHQHLVVDGLEGRVDQAHVADLTGNAAGGNKVANIKGSVDENQHA